MNLARLALISFILILSGPTNSMHARSPADSVGSENYTIVDPCELKANPGKFNHKRLEITGFVSFSFENFSLDGLDCKSDQGVWLEFGGLKAAGSIYCCGVTAKRSRPKPLIVEGIRVNLTDDKVFREFRRLISKTGNVIVRSTIRGRFFAGEKVKYPSGKEIWSGFGHFGMNTLFAIERVVSYDRHKNLKLSYKDAHPYWHPEVKRCLSSSQIGLKKSGRQLQIEADQGLEPWSFDEPGRVAATELTKATGLRKFKVSDLTKRIEQKGFISYSWRNPKTGQDYVVSICRPYMLSFFAKDPEKVRRVPHKVIRFTHCK